MSNTQQQFLSVEPVISYPREAQVGKTYLMTIDLQWSGDSEWHYEDEEYPIYCMLETSPLFSHKPVGKPAIVLHRFGGSYGAAKFLLTASEAGIEGKIRITLVNGWGVPLTVLYSDDIKITSKIKNKEIIGYIFSGRPERLAKNIADLNKQLQSYDIYADREKWVEIQNALGWAYLESSAGERAENIESAIASFKAALETRTREAFPRDWAETQNNLGIAYMNRIRGEVAENIESAIASFKAALEVYTREAFPRDWEMTQKHLNNAYKSLEYCKIEIELFSFETVFVNHKGETIKQETWSASHFRQKLPSIDSEDITLEMVAIPGGTFIMGTAEKEIERLCQKYESNGWKKKFRRERPQHEVTLEPFFMGRTPITQAQWRAIASRTDLKVNRDLDPDPAHFKDNPDPQTLPNYKSSQRVPTRWDRPVEKVSGYEAQEFCDRLSKLTGREYRLPSEAEWEYACRAILPDCQNLTYTPFHFGETLTDQLANYRANCTDANEPLRQCREQTTPVRSFPPNAVGLYDLHGNVWEWCLDDWHENYEGAPTDGTEWRWPENKDSEPRKMWRGGCWGDDASWCRAAFRNYYHPNDHFNSVGFRVVCVPGRTDLVPQLLKVLEFFSLKTVFVNDKGETIQQETHRASYFKEQLPPIDSEDITLEMVKIPGGTFTMGTKEDEIEGLCQKYSVHYFRRESPQHQVTIKSFFMGRTPITQAQWRAIASRTDLKEKLDLNPDPAEFKDNPDPQTLPNYKSSQRALTRWDRPVERVSWEEAVEFCQRLSKLTKREYRLPSEAEWEYACRAILPDCQNPTYSPFYFGETLTDQLANYRATSTYADEPLGQFREQTTPVGSFPPNAFGLYDMHGNVWEWCLDDWHENYEGAPTDGKAWLENNHSKSHKIQRGGSWYSLPYSCRAASRGLIPVNHYSPDGFRVVCVSDRTL